MLDEGRLHKKWRDETWTERREIVSQRKLRNQQSASKVRLAVTQQMYNTNVKRMQDIQTSSLERYESDLESLNQLSLQVQEYSDYV